MIVMISKVGHVGDFFTRLRYASTPETVLKRPLRKSHKTFVDGHGQTVVYGQTWWICIDIVLRSAPYLNTYNKLAYNKNYKKSSFFLAGSDFTSIPLVCSSHIILWLEKRKNLTMNGKVTKKILKICNKTWGGNRFLKVPIGLNVAFLLH